MVEEDKLSIRVNIAGRYYPLKIERKDEEKVRKAIKYIDEKFLSFKQRYADKDVQDWMSMVSMFFAMKVVETEMDDRLTQVLQGMQHLDTKISEYIDYVEEK